ncbi:hypothetical protein EG68_06413 [Paragonimus skrjabini miyazakii]|uniref:Polypeptide N-acetylgalactosaminyltransferase n=1 Tax=Paragonimus skrjabini miyazakii TaxID=59628 RepID=A0A8S9Z038_9TREM|nr:hypothetical protein EG68_06413 [Paragonimus skrjabini miyazakii]
MAFIVERTKLTEYEREQYDSGWTNHAFNQFASDRISVRRHIADVREGLCRSPSFSSNLPPTAVIICFHNECWSTLLRSVHSVLDTTPENLLKEIILVDDYSTYDYLKLPLDQYVKQLTKVKVIHTEKREGLIRARLIGMNATTAEVLTFLDSHIECTEGWLEPLLECIHANHSSVVSPVIDRIHDDTFAYDPLMLNDIRVGGFDWDLSFRWHFPPQRDLSRPGAPYSPINTPTIAGGLFSIHRGFFERLGFYDQQMEIWGGENLELSFKACVITWMCGGSLKIHPCSHIGHVFRAKSPYAKSDDAEKIVYRNLIRLAEVWMDKYKGYFYEKFDFALDQFGDISERKALRAQLQCRSFGWYLDNVFPEMFVPSKALASGDIENRQLAICIDASIMKTQPHLHILQGYPCRRQGGNQLWFWTHNREIRRQNKCWTVDEKSLLVSMFRCQGRSVQKFEYTKDGTLQYKNLCIELDSNNVSIYLAYCTGMPNQVWKFARIAYSPPVGYTIASSPIR